MLDHGETRTTQIIVRESGTGNNGKRLKLPWKRARPRVWNGIAVVVCHYNTIDQIRNIPMEHPEASAPPAEEVLSPLEYAELYSMACATETDLEGQTKTKKALKLKAYARRLKAAVQQRVEKEVAETRSKRWTWKSPQPETLELQKQLQDLQGLIDDVSSVASVEDGAWRYKKVWEPKMRFIEEDVERGVPEHDIGEKYDIYDAAGEALQYRQSMKLLGKISEESKQAEETLLQAQTQNESESLRLLSFFDVLQDRIESAIALEDQAKQCEAAVASVRTAASGLNTLLKNSSGLSDTPESHQPFLRGAQESAQMLSRQAEEARKNFRMLQKSNEKATKLLNAQLQAYEEAQRSCGLLSGTLQDLQQTMLEHKENPPLPSVLESKKELLSEILSSLQRCSFTAKALEAFEVEARLKEAVTEQNLAKALRSAKHITGVDPVLLAQKEELLTSLTERRTRQETLDREREETRQQREQDTLERKERCRLRCRTCLRNCCSLISCIGSSRVCRKVARICYMIWVLSLTVPLTIGTLAGFRMNFHWLFWPPKPEQHQEFWALLCICELALTGLVVLALSGACCWTLHPARIVCGILFSAVGGALCAGILPNFEAWSSAAPVGWASMRVVSIFVSFALFLVAWRYSMVALLEELCRKSDPPRPIPRSPELGCVLALFVIAGILTCCFAGMPVWAAIVPFPMTILIMISPLAAPSESWDALSILHQAGLPKR